MMHAGLTQVSLDRAGAQASSASQAQMAGILGRYMAAFDLLGRIHVAQDARQQTGKPIILSGTVPVRGRFADSTASDSVGSLLDAFTVPFQGAVDRIANLTSFTKQAFDALQQRYKQQAFTVAGVNDVRVIEKIQQALADVVQSGGTQTDFEKAVNAITDDAGIARISAFNIDVAFQTNVQTAYANGRFAQMRDPSVMSALPYWRYATVGDDRVRPAHAALNGFVAKASDPVWNRIYPPNGYNCRCSVYPILADEAPDDADVPGSQRIPLAAAYVPDPGFGGMTQ